MGAVGCGRLGYGVIERPPEDAGADIGADSSSPPTDSSTDALIPDADASPTDAGPPPNPVTHLASGVSHSCAVIAGQAWCWGSNVGGRLGDGTTDDAPLPVAVVGLPGPVEEISCGHEHTCAVVEGQAWCWGRGSAGELGSGVGRDSATPVSVLGLPGLVTRIAAGDRFTCAISANRAWCWGADNAGSLGRGVAGGSLTPVPVMLDRDVVELTAGQDHACTVAADRATAWCWGHNDGGGALGSPAAGGSELSPIEVAFPVGTSDIEVITIGGWHTCALVAGGVWCWGEGSRGEIGDGMFATYDMPVPVPGLETGVSRLSVYGNPTFHDVTCTVQGGGMSCWGANSTGRVGDGTVMDRGVATPVGALPEMEKVGSGGDHVCAAGRMGRIFCWGAGMSGQLGDGRSLDSLTPVEVMPSW